jgi:hypothetical protein
MALMVVVIPRAVNPLVRVMYGSWNYIVFVMF